MSEQSKDNSIDFTDRHAEIAARHGFRITKEFEAQDYYRKDDADGSFWLASTTSGLAFDLASPESHIWFIGRFMQGEGGEARVVVHEPLPIEVVLSEHGRIPTPSFDVDGDPIERDFDKWSDLHWVGHGGKRSWRKFDSVTRSIPGLETMFEQGFELTQTGGGCTAFQLHDEESDTYWLVSSEFGVSHHPLSQHWCVQREISNGDAVGVNYTTIPEIIARFRDIPMPREDQDKQYIYFDDWAQLDDHLYEVGLAGRPA
jgi:hypothetical protein